MTIITPGYRYVANNFDNPTNGQTIQFIEKKLASDGSANFEMVYDGTTNEELLKILIDRIGFLQQKFPCRENAIAITKLEESLMWLEKRTNERKARGVEGQHVK